MNNPRFSLVIPAYNEEAYLPRLLDTVDIARARYRGGADAIEVIVADNNSTDSTLVLAVQRGCKVVSVEQRVIAAVRNGGAAAARGEILAFVDADFRIHPETFNVIDELLASGRIIGGATGVTMERWSVGIAVTYAMLMPMVKLMNMDTGVVFCRKPDFEAVSGYDETRLLAEDVAFLLALRRLGKTRKQKLACSTAARAIVSVRKFDEHGDWHYLTGIPRVLVAMLFSKRYLVNLTKRYWYVDRRE